MEEKIKLIMKRLSELQEFLRIGRGDPRFIRSMIDVNEDILFLLRTNKDIRFYKVEEPVEIKPSPRKVFFCPPKKSDDPSPES